MSIALSVGIRLAAGLVASILILKVWPRILDSLERPKESET